MQRNRVVDLRADLALGQKFAKLVATGGMSKLIASGSKYLHEVDLMLTLTGLRIIYERNAERGRKRAAASAAVHA